MLEVLGDDPRFTCRAPSERARFYRNFERALALAPAEAELFALCDQDDRWYPEKLSVLRGALGDAQLVYSDQRLVDAEGRVLRESMWKGRRNNHTDLTSLLVANSITGAATLFRREVAELALPFPETPGMQFHDHWLGLVALAAGEIAYVDRPALRLRPARGCDLRRRLRRLRGAGRTTRRSLREALLERVRGGRGAYFLGYLPRDMQARVLLVLCDGRLTRSKRRALERFVASADSPSAFALAGRCGRCESWPGATRRWEARPSWPAASLWRWLVEILAKGARTPGRRPIDARYPNPLSFEQKRLRRWRARA